MQSSRGVWWRTGIAGSMVAAAVVAAAVVDRTDRTAPPSALAGSLQGPRQETAGESDLRKPDRPSVARPPTVTSSPSTQVLGGAWSALGPKPARSIYTGINVGGRVTALALDPTTQGSTIYAGTMGGGVWKSTDGGLTWVPKSDAAASLAIGALAVDSTGQVVYAATGEDNGSTSQYGQGILKSANGGSTWALVGQSTLGGRHIGGIAIDRMTSGATQRVFAATDAGLYVSTDAGTSWTLDTSLTNAGAVPIGPPGTSSGAVYEVVQDSTTPATWWASVGDRCVTEAGNIAQSTDGGTTWRNVKSFSASVSRPALGVGAGGVAYVAPAACDGSLLGGEISKTLDGGGSWDPLPTPSISYLGTSFLGFQGWYDNVVSVDPANAAHAVFGGVTLLATSDGGTTFADVGQVYATGLFGTTVLHPDMHAVAFTGALDNLYVGTDGGVWRTSNLGGTGTFLDWSNRNATFATAEFYYGTSPNIATPLLLGGTQDNGTLGNRGIVNGDFAPPLWNFYLVGDGGYTLWDFGSGQVLAYAENQYIHMWRTNPGGGTQPASPCDSFDSSQRCVRGGVPERTPFVAPFVADPVLAPSGYQTLFAGTYRVYKSVNGGFPAGSEGWSVVSGDLTLGGNDTLAVMTRGRATTPGTPLVLFTGSQFGAVWRSVDGGASWANITGNLPTATDATYVFPNPFASGIAFNRANPDEVWVSIGGVNVPHIWHTLDAGAQSPVWTSLDGSGADAIPNAPTFSIVVDPTDASRVYVGTYYGARACTACGGATPSPAWRFLGTGLPNTAVAWLSLSDDGSSLVAWTRGRGAWSLPTPTVLTGVAVAAFAARTTAGGVAVSWRTASETGILGFEVWRGSGKRAVRLNRRLLSPKHAGRVGGATYTLLDRTAARGRYYLYRLRFVGLDGTRAWAGAVAVRPRR